MKWLKDLPIDISMFFIHIKTLLAYIIDDISEIIKDIFTIPKD